MNRLMFWTCCALVAMTPVASAWGIATPSLTWTLNVPADLPGANCYYLNGSLDAGSALVGQISFGVRWVDVSGVQLASLDTTPANMFNGHGAKSMVRIGDYYYLVHDDAAFDVGVGRIDATGANAWAAASWGGTVNPTGTHGPESLATDGTLLFTNDDTNRGVIHAYSVANTPTSFTLTEAWNSNVGSGRILGLHYDDASGYLYMHNGGDRASTTIYAMDGDTGAFTVVGMHNEGANKTYQVLRCNNQLLIAGESENLTVYDLTSDTSIDATPVATYALGVGDIYGLSRNGGTLFVASLNKLSAFQIYIPGDANYDGIVDLLDLGIVGDNWNGTGKEWETGDFNGDGIVDLLDLGVVGDNWNATAEGAVPNSVPETSTLTLLVLGAMAALLCRGQRSSAWRMRPRPV